MKSIYKSARQFESFWHRGPEYNLQCFCTFSESSLSYRYVTLITALVESFAFVLDVTLGDSLTTGELFTHCPVNWFTLNGLLMSWGLVPTGFLCGWWLWICAGMPMTFAPLFGGSLQSNEPSWGVNGLCRDMHGLAKLTDGLARLVEGLGSIIDGLVRLERPDRPPGLDNEWFKLSASSSGGVWASPMLPQLPRLSSEWFPSLLSADSMYRIHFFLRLEQIRLSQCWHSIVFLFLEDILAQSNKCAKISRL